MTSLAQGAAGVAMVLAFALLHPRQVGGALNLLTAQAVMVFVALLAQRAYLPAAAELVFGVVAGPMALRRMMVPLQLPHETDVAGGIQGAMAAGGVFAVLSLPFGDAALPLAVVLLSLLLVGTRRHPMMQVIGLAALQNGIALAAAPIGSLAGGAGDAAGDGIAGGAGGGLAGSLGGATGEVVAAGIAGALAAAPGLLAVLPVVPGLALLALWHHRRSAA